MPNLMYICRLLLVVYLANLPRTHYGKFLERSCPSFVLSVLIFQPKTFSPGSPVASFFYGFDQHSDTQKNDKEEYSYARSAQLHNPAVRME